MDPQESTFEPKDEVATTTLSDRPVHTETKLQCLKRERDLRDRTLLTWSQALHGNTNTSSIAGRNEPDPQYCESEMARQNVETVERAVAALNRRDMEGYLSCCTDDIELHIMAVEAIGGEYVGRDAIRRFWTDIADVSPDFSVEIERAESIADEGVVAFMRVNATGRTTGIAILDDVRTVNVYDFRRGKICRVRAFNDRAAGLAAAGVADGDTS